MFRLVSGYEPQGDQPAAIEKLCRWTQAGASHQVLLGVTGSGKTFSMAQVIQRLNRPALVISHNKTLAAQLYAEFKSFFPHNRVEYFVSYYDYYQPEAYVAATDTYIEKDAAINQELDRLRLSATHALLERRDTVVVSSVSCIYGLGDPDIYRGMYLSLELGKEYSRQRLLSKLVEMQYVRAQFDFTRGQFRVRGERLEIFPAYADEVLALDFLDDRLQRIHETDSINGKTLAELDRAAVYPAKIYVLPPEEMERALQAILAELAQRLRELGSQDKLLEAQRLEQRTRFDLEILKETGTCSGIENYSRHLDGRPPGSAPKCLLDYLPKDALIFIDESHVSLPQIRGMYVGDRSRKQTLVDYGFRLPSALDNRPLRFEEFESRVRQVIHVSATPGDWELQKSETRVAEQIIRPTGLCDPELEQRPASGEVDDLMGEVKTRAAKGERSLVTTLTKRMAEELCEYFRQHGVRVEYLHSDIEVLERVQILRRLRLGEFDCLVGINLLREGLDLPEVSLVAILDADKEGFLRSERSLIQTMGRAARNVGGKVLLYADRTTDSMARALAETRRRRQLQMEWNARHGITPQSVRSSIKDALQSVCERDYYTVEPLPQGQGADLLDPQALPALLIRLEKEMRAAAARLDFERAAKLRDQVRRLRSLRPGEALSFDELWRCFGGKERVQRRGSLRGSRLGDPEANRRARRWRASARGV